MVSGLEAGEFGPQGHIPLSNTASAQPAWQPSAQPTSFNPSSYGQAPRQPTQAPANYQEAYQAFAEPLANLAESAQEEIPPLGFAIAQLKGIYILSENQQFSAG